jgi:disulfide bond formation protein DsbB
MRIDSRTLFPAMLLVAAGLLAFGYYLQFGLGQEPCPMCIFQRFAYMGVVALALAATALQPYAAGARCYAALLGLTSAIGGAIAARQTWLQHLPPDQVPECGPGLSFMLEVYPLADVIKKALAGTGECAQVTWRFLGLSIAEWSLLWFTVLAVAAIAAFLRPRRV